MKIKFTVVFQDDNRCICEGTVGQTIYDALKQENIILDKNCLLTCVLHIESLHLKPATQDESMDLKERYDHSNGYRYAHTYTIDENFNESTVSLNVARIRYVDKSNKEHLLYAYIGENLFNLRERYPQIIDRTFSCGGSLACCTCHIYVSKKFFDILDHISAREEDMLETIENVSDFSRLGCTININKNLDNIRLLHPRSENSLENARLI